MGPIIMISALVIIGIGWGLYFTRKRAKSGDLSGRAGGSGGGDLPRDHR